MELRVLFFAALGERVGARQATWTLPQGTDVAGLRQDVVRRYPDVASLVGRSSVAVNSEYAADSRVLQAGDEVALLPPVSGGAAAR